MIRQTHREPDINTEKDEYEPLDTVSKIVWDTYSSQDPSFLTASWDGFVRYYQIKRIQKRTYGSFEEVMSMVWSFYCNQPVLCCQITGNQLVIAGLANGQIIVTSLTNSSQTMTIGFHDAPICQLFWIQQMQVLLSLGFDNLLRIWTFESRNNSYLQKQYKLPAKTMTADYDYPFLMIGGNDGKGTFIQVSRQTITNLNIPQRYQTFDLDILSNFTCCRLNLKCSTALVGAIDGRLIVIELVVENPTYNRPGGIKLKKQPTKSKAQKKQIYRNGKSILLGSLSGMQIGSYKGNPILIGYGTLSLQIYYVAKKQIHATVKGTYDSSITAGRLCPKNQYLVYACGTDWSKGLQSLVSEKRPKLKALKLKEQQLDMYSKTY